MQALIVVAHPEAGSLSHQVADEVGRGLSAAGHQFELADLAAEAFDPRFITAARPRSTRCSCTTPNPRPPNDTSPELLRSAHR